MVLKSKNDVKNKFLINLHPFGCILQPTLVDFFFKFELSLQAAQAGLFVVLNCKNKVLIKLHPFECTLKPMHFSYFENSTLI